MCLVSIYVRTMSASYEFTFSLLDAFNIQHSGCVRMINGPSNGKVQEWVNNVK